MACTARCRYTVFHNTMVAVKQIQATGPVALLLKSPVLDFAQPVEEGGAGQRVAGFAFV